MHPTNESQQANTGKPVRDKPFSAYPRQLAIVKGALHTANRRNRIAIIDLKSATLKRERLDVRR